MNNSAISLTGVGAIITIMQVILPLFGLTLPDGSLEEAANGVIAIVGVVTLIWGQMRRRDMKWFLLRK
jgi:uncharacterized membrane protein